MSWKRANASDSAACSDVGLVVTHARTLSTMGRLAIAPLVACPVSWESPDPDCVL